MPLALVTGASGGIGVEFCKVLAKKKYDLILVSSYRSAEKLKLETAPELEKNYAVKCHVMPCDLADISDVKRLYKEILGKKLEVSFLVNNAGLLFNGYFHELNLDKQLSLLNVNINALTALSHLFVNDMSARGNGYILNVSSTAAWQAIPNENVYAASKAYVLAFTHALADEMDAAKTGVKVTALCPHYTDTKMLNNPEQGQKLKSFSGAILSPEYVAAKGIEECLAGNPTVIPGIMNIITTSLYQLIPKMMLARMAGKIYRKNLTN